MGLRLSIEFLCTSVVNFLAQDKFDWPLKHFELPTMVFKGCSVATTHIIIGPQPTDTANNPIKNTILKKEKDNTGIQEVITNFKATKIIMQKAVRNFQVLADKVDLRTTKSIHLMMQQYESAHQDRMKRWEALFHQLSQKLPKTHCTTGPLSALDVAVDTDNDDNAKNDENKEDLLLTPLQACNAS